MSIETHVGARLKIMSCQVIIFLLHYILLSRYVSSRSYYLPVFIYKEFLFLVNQLKQEKVLPEYSLFKYNCKQLRIFVLFNQEGRLTSRIIMNSMLE